MGPEPDPRGSGGGRAGNEPPSHLDTVHLPYPCPSAGRVAAPPVPVADIVSGAFGVFRGSQKGPDRGEGSPRFSLVLVASGRFLCTYARWIDCQVLAEELAPLEVACWV